MNKVLKRFKAFNDKHRKLAPVAIYPELAVIVIASFFGYLRKHLKVVLPVLLAVIVAIVAIRSCGSMQRQGNVEEEAMAVLEEAESKKEEAISEGAEEADGNVAAKEPAETVEEAGKESEEAPADDTQNEAEVVASDSTVQEEGSSAEQETSAEVEQADDSSPLGSDAVADVQSADAVNSEGIGNTADAGDMADVGNAAEVADDTGSEDAGNTGETQDAPVRVMESVSNEEIGRIMDEYPEAVAWIKFEDNLISYPVMQSGDNSKYKILDYEGNEANTGSIFLDYRSAADFTDPNTIIYGHNMKDYSMFGAFKYYKNNLGFLKDHKYFRIITKDEELRYMIFAFMAVPRNSEVYNVCGSSADGMRQFLDTIEYRTYIDTGVEPTVDDKIITLSTCTDSDDLYFVMFGVKIE